MPTFATLDHKQESLKEQHELLDEALKKVNKVIRLRKHDTKPIREIDETRFHIHEALWHINSQLQKLIA